MQSKFPFFLLILLSSIMALSFNLANNNDKTSVKETITGYWIGLEPGSNDYEIVYKIQINDSNEYTCLEYGFENGYYDGHWNLDSISFSESKNTLYLYNMEHNCSFHGQVNFKDQTISGIIQSYEVNGPIVLKRIEEKAIKGLYPRGSTENEKTSYNYRQPQLLNDGWETSTLENEDVNSQLVIEAINKIIKQEFMNITSLLIVKNNKLVCEEYFYGSDDSHLNKLGSCSKSVTSILFGIAIDQAKIKGVNEVVIDYFPEYKQLKTEENSKILTKHLLTMTAGFDWDEYSVPYNHPQNTLLQMGESEDYLKYIFKRSIVDTPGEKFNYSCANTILLGWILKKSTGMNPDRYAEQNLFNHLGIDKYYWHIREDGFTHVEGGLKLTARDMAKIGSLILNNGKWNNDQIVSAEWIAESTHQHVPQNNWQPGYGYQWWNIYYPVQDKTMYGIMAMGADPQMIIIIPELNTIIVTTGPFTFVDEDKSPLRMIMQYIIPSLL